MAHDWNKKLKISQEWEPKIKPVLEKLFFKLKLEVQDYNTLEGRKNQLNGIDGIIKQDSFAYDLKVNDFRYFHLKNPLLETISVKNEYTETPGWAYTSQADFIVHVWENSSGNNLMP